METPVKPIAIGADDAAYDLKAAIVDHLKSQGIAIEDYGIDDRSSKIIYPDVALLVAPPIKSRESVQRSAMTRIPRNAPARVMIAKLWHWEAG